MAEPLPAILHNPRLSEYLNFQERSSPPYLAKRPLKSFRIQNGGKRWIRRNDNVHFAGNPHIVTATQRDYALQTPRALPTFPVPLPPFLSRNARLPTTVIPTRDPNSANAGRFSMSLKGLRRELRKSGFRAEVLVRDIECEVVNWLQVGGTVLAPDTSESTGTLDLGSCTPIGDTGTIFEISRTPLQLIWSITDDPFARYIVHCCARYYEIVSFSKEISGQRFTYLLRPNVLYPDHRAPGGIDTPPVTDDDYSYQLDAESDRGSLDIDSDIDQHPNNTSRPLPSISEGRISTSPVLADEPWSPVEDADLELETDASLAAGLDRLSLLPDNVSESTHIPSPQMGSHFDGRPFLHRRIRSHHRRQERSASSPSRSPARKSYYRDLRPLLHRSKDFSLPPHHQTFYDYLFS